MKYNSNPSLTDQNSSAKIKQLITQISQAQEDISVIQATLASQGIHLETADLEASLAEIKKAQITDATVNEETVATLKASDIETQSLKSKTVDTDALTTGSLTSSGTVNAPVIKGDSIQATSAVIPSIQTQTLAVKEMGGDTATLNSLNAKAITADKETATTITTETIQMPDSDAVIRGQYLSIKADKVNANSYSVNGEELIKILYNVLVGNSNRNLQLVSQGRPTVSENGTLHYLSYKDEIGDPFVFKGVVSSVSEITDFTSGYVYFATDTASAVICDGSQAHEAPLSNLLGAYRTAELQDSIDEGFTTSITTNAANIATNADNIATNKQLIELETSEREEAVEKLQTSFDSISTDFEELRDNVKTDEEEIETIKDTYTPEAPKDGMLYGRMDGEWKQFSGDATYLNKKFKDEEEEIESSITNDEDGIVLQSTKDIKTSTSSTSEYSDKTKTAVVNREYLHNNLSISKSADTSKIDYTYHMVNGTENPNNGRSNTYIEGSGPSTYYEHCSTKRGNAVLRLKDYVVYSIIDPVNFTDSTYTAHLNICSENGKVYKLNEATAYYSTTNYYTFVLATYHPKYIKAHPECGNIFFAFNCIKNTILVYDGLHFLKEIQLGEATILALTSTYNSIWPQGQASLKTGSIATSHSTTAVVVPQFQFMKDHPYGVVFFSDDKGTGDTHAIFLGKDEDGNEGPTCWKDCPLPMVPTRRSAASGNDNIWFIGGRSSTSITSPVNFVVAVGTNGETDTYTIQNSTTTVNSYTVSPSRAFLECDNGDVICPIAAYTTDSPSTALLSWVYCDDTKTETNYEAKLIPGNNGSNDLTTTTIADTAGYPCFAETSMFETDKYYFAFPQSPMVPNDYQFFALTAASQNRYYKISKEDLSVENFTTPWTATATVCGNRNVVHTYKDGERYTWIFPTNLSTDNVLIVKEDGSVIEKVIDIDPDGYGYKLIVGASVKYDMYYNSSYATYAQMKQTGLAVNDSGIGIALFTSTFPFILLFRGEEYSYRMFSTTGANTAGNNWGKNTIGTYYSAAWFNVNAIGDEIIYDCGPYGTYYGVNIFKVDSDTLEISDRTPIQLVNTNALGSGSISGCYTFLSDTETKYYHWDSKYRDNQCKLAVFGGKESPASGDFVQILARYNNYVSSDTIYLKDNDETISHT